MSAEFGVLPSVTVFGQVALEERTSWHVAFDFAIWQRFVKARAEATKSNAKPTRAKKMYSGDNLPDLILPKGAKHG